MSICVSDIMTRNLRTIEPEMSVSEAHTFAKNNRIRHLLVFESKTQKFMGILSDRDLNKIMSPFAGTSRATTQDNATLDVSVSIIMHKTVISCKPSDSLKSVVEKMLQKKVSGLPVLEEDGKLVGIVTSDDLLKALLRFL